MHEAIDMIECVDKYLGGDYKDMKEMTLRLGALTDNEREIILKGCLINYNKR